MDAADRFLPVLDRLWKRKAVGAAERVLRSWCSIDILVFTSVQLLI
jgi:hypothetical protein